MVARRSRRLRTGGGVLAALAFAIVPASAVYAAPPSALSSATSAVAATTASTTTASTAATGGAPTTSATGAAFTTAPTPSLADRIAVTNRVWSNIEQQAATGRGLETPGDNETGAQDVIDYGVQNLWSKGIDGAGTTVAVILTSSDDADLSRDLATYDDALGLPPLDLTKIEFPGGASRCSYDRKSAWCDDGEEELDLESIHTMAPYAKIVLMLSGDPETAGMQGMPDLAQSVEYVADHHLANVISMSEGTDEGAFAPDVQNPGVAAGTAIRSLQPALLDAAAHGIPFLSSAGDCGSTDPGYAANEDAADNGCQPTLKTQTVSVFDDSPWVTSVGGTDIGISERSGERTGPDTLWSESGGGISAIYSAPAYQKGVSSVTDTAKRTLPDLVMDSNNGTSQSAPTLAGILALATQERGGPLGPINSALYERVGPGGTADGIVDVTQGNNSGGKGMPGYTAGPGYDIASGWGTVYAPAFVPALAAAITAQDAAKQTPAQQARAALSALERKIAVNHSRVTAGQRVTITGVGFIPGATKPGMELVHQKISRVSGSGASPWDAITASVSPRIPSGRISPAAGDLTGTAEGVHVVGATKSGSVAFEIDTSGLAKGVYRVTLKGKLLTEHTRFTVR